LIVAETGTGRVLGLDLGDARIGVAISDPDRRLAVPVGTIHVGQRASSTTPARIGPTLPSSVRVPSGKASTTLPALSRRSVSLMAPISAVLRLTG
jgi:putative Holliday junction resolvase